MYPPFLLPNGTSVYHTSSITPNVDSEDHYYLTCFLYQLLSQLHPNPSIVNRRVRISMDNYSIDTNQFLIGSDTYSPFEAMHSLVIRLPTRLFPACCDYREYRALLEFSIEYSGLLGILTASSEDMPLRKIASPYWHIENEWFESTKPMYHMQVIANVKKAKGQLSVDGHWGPGSRAPCIVTGGTGTGKTKVVPKLFFYYYCIYTSDQYFVSGQYASDVILALPRVFLAEGVYADYQAALGYSPANGSSQYQSPLVLLAGGNAVKWPQEFPGPKFIIGTSESLFKYTDSCGLAMIDEFHEHDLKSDIFFSLLFKAKKHIVLITATPSAADEALFPTFMPNTERIHIAATKVFRIKISSTKASLKNYLEVSLAETYRVCRTLLTGQALLVFLPRVEDVKKFMSMIAPMLPDFIIVPFYSTVSMSSRKLISQYEAVSKLLIVATQAAESSVTFRTLVNVIDSGLEVRIKIEQEGDFHTYRSIPVVQYINQYQYLQRRGRVGRLQTGSVVLLYDPDSLSTLAPSLLDSNLTTLVLLMKKFQLEPSDLFVTMTGPKKDLFDRIQAKVAAVDVTSVDLNYLKNIYWLESVAYFANPSIPASDKELYMALWEPLKYEIADAIYYKIKYPSFIPRRRVVYSSKTDKFVELVEELPDNQRIRITIPINCFLGGRSIYDQITLTYTRPA